MRHSEDRCDLRNSLKLATQSPSRRRSDAIPSEIGRSCSNKGSGVQCKITITFGLTTARVATYVHCAQAQRQSFNKSSSGDRSSAPGIWRTQTETPSTLPSNHDLATPTNLQEKTRSPGAVPSPRARPMLRAPRPSHSARNFPASSRWTDCKEAYHAGARPVISKMASASSSAEGASTMAPTAQAATFRTRLSVETMWRSSPTADGEQPKLNASSCSTCKTGIPIAVPIEACAFFW